VGCFKDGNDDDVNDCTDPICRRDLKAQITIPENHIPNMNEFGYFINFTVYGDSQDFSYADRFYYCVDSSNTCCPTTVQNLNCDRVTAQCSVSINPSNDLNDYTEAGIYYIRYYSIDNHNNVEEVKSLPFYIDKTLPSYSLAYTTEKQTGTLSNLTILLDSQEFISCNYTMSPSVSASLNEFVSGRINQTFRVVFNNLEDGIYTFTTSCSDDVNNANSIDWTILVDSVQQIRNPSPNLATLNYQNVQLYVETADASNCTANNLLGNNNIPLTQTLIGPRNYTHTANRNFPSGTYSFAVNCVPHMGVREPDTSFIFFTRHLLSATSFCSISFKCFSIHPFSIIFDNNN